MHDMTRIRPHQRERFRVALIQMLLALIDGSNDKVGIVRST
jgi:hypothetical protein